MSLPRKARLFAMIAVAAGGAAASLAGLSALNAGGSIALGSAELLPLAAGFDRRAQAALAGAETPSQSALADSAARSRKAIAQHPYGTSAWVRLAYLDTVQNGRLTSVGIEALKRSYDLVPADLDVGVWRVTLTLENTGAVPRELLESAHQEVATLGTVWRYRAKFRSLRRELQNDGGRLAMHLWLNQIERDTAQ